jgi:hypothetical protein
MRDVRGGICIRQLSRISDVRKSIAEASNVIDRLPQARAMLRGARTIDGAR